MTPFRKFVVVCAAIFAALYVAYLVIFPTVYLRYRLTLDVDVDGVTHTGSGVVEIAYHGMPEWLGGIGGGAQAHFIGEMRGYAITVDLGARGLLFVVDSYPFLADPRTGRIALANAANLGMLPFAAYGLSQSQLPSTGIAHARALREKKGPVDLPLEKLPMIVRFTDINDRSTIEELDPRDLATAYGADVRLVHAEFEFAADPVSPMPKSWPKWLSEDKASEYRFSHQELWSFVTIWTSAFKGDNHGRDH